MRVSICKRTLECSNFRKALCATSFADTQVCTATTSSCLSVSNAISNVGLFMPTLVGSVPLRKQEKDGTLSHQPFMDRWLYGAVASTGAIISA